MSKIRHVLRLYFQKKEKKVISQQTIVDAILDRIVYDAHRIKLIGE